MAPADWLILTATLPTHPSALRVRVWRALKATGAATLREGVYLLPASAEAAPALRAIERTIAEAGADAHLLVVGARDAAQDAAFRALFDRSAQHDELVQSIKALRRSVKSAGEAELRKSLRTLEQQRAAIQAGDHFPGPASAKSAAALDALRREIDRRLSPGEPAPGRAPLERLAIDDFQGRTWATRKRPWVDRLASAWLVQARIDRAPRFVWFDATRGAPKSALGYDYDGARFSHVDGRVTFEVLAASFGLDADPALVRVGELVHSIDVGGVPVDEAPGVEAIVRGLQARHRKDDELLAASLPLFDALYAAWKAPAR